MLKIFAIYKKFFKFRKSNCTLSVSQKYVDFSPYIRAIRIHTYLHPNNVYIARIRSDTNYALYFLLDSIPWKRGSNKKEGKEKEKRRLLLLSTGFLIPLHKFQPTSQVSRKESQLRSLMREREREIITNRDTA